MMGLLLPHDGPPAWAKSAFDAGVALVKFAGDPEVAYNLAGTLYLSPNGWLLLSVPNALVRGVFAAMHEPGAELPPGPDGKLTAHVTIMSKEEVAQIGADRITERGKQFHYTLGRLYEVEPDGWEEMEKCWFVRVTSPELQELRRSYGLSSLPNEGRHAFHVTIGVRKRGVLGRNEKAKGVELLPA